MPFNCALLCLLVLWNIRGTDNLQVRLSSKCLSEELWVKAHRCCLEEGLTLPNSLARDDNYRLLEAMKNRSIVSTWLAFRRVALPQWTWVDDTVYEPTRMMDRGRCAVYNSTSGDIQGTDCSSMNFQQICEVKDCEGCSALGHYGQMCHKSGRRCFVILYGHDSWYNARALCRSHKWDLAVLDIPKSIPLSSKKSYWIGLRKEEWAFKENARLQLPGSSHWGPNEPRGSDSCAAVHVNGDLFEWKTKPCLEKTFVFCSKDEMLTFGTKILEKAESPTTTSYAEEQGENTIILIIIVMSVIVVLILLSTIVFLLFRKRRAFRQTTQMFTVMSPEDLPLTYTGNAPEISPLLESNDEKELLQKSVAEAVIRYYSQINPWYWEEDLSPADMEDLYTEQSLTRVIRSGYKTSRLSVESYSQIFPKDTTSTFIYLEGAAGTGKTTLCRRILADWGKLIVDKDIEHDPRGDEIYASKFQFVLPIFLRYVQSGEDVFTAVQTQLSLSVSQAESLRDIVQSNPEKCLFVLDGYDEYNEKWSSEITALAKWTKLPGSSVLLTSRYTPREHFGSSKIPVINHILLGGFSEENIFVYIKRFLSAGKECTELEKESAEKDCIELEKQLRDSTELMNFAVNPAVLFLICVLWRHTKELPSTLTKFFLKLTKYICGRYDYKYADQIAYQDDILEKYHENLMEIGKFAKEGSLSTNMKLHFNRDVTINQMGEVSWKLGFFVVEHGPQEMGKVRFPHRSYQDFFAAYFIQNMKDRAEKENILSKLLVSCRSVNRWNAILSYLLGMGGEPMLHAMQNELQGREPGLQTTIQVLFLIENPDIRCVLPEVIDICPSEHNRYILSLLFSQTGDHVTEIIFRIGEVTQIWPIGLLHAPGLQSLHLYFKTEFGGSIYDPQEVTQLDTFTNLVTLIVTGVRHMEKSDEPTLRYIVDSLRNIRHFEYSDSRMVPMDLLLECLDGKRNLQTLRFRKNNIPQSDMDRLFESISKWPKLHVLDLHGNSREIDNVSVLAKSIKKGSTLQELRLCQSSFEALNELFSGLCDATTLKIIDLRGEERSRRRMRPEQEITIDDVSDEYIQLAEALRKCTDMQELRLRTSYYLDAMKPLVKTLQYMYNIKILDVSSNVVRKSVYNNLGDVLGNLKSVKELRLCDCLLADRIDGLAVIHSLKGMSNLSVLEFGCYALNQKGLTELGNTLKELPNLAELLMRSTDTCDRKNDDASQQQLYEEAWSVLLMEMSVCTKLRTLDIGSNRIGNMSISNAAKHISKLQELKVVMIDDCQLAKVAPLFDLVAGPGMITNIEDLDLSNNSFGDELENLINNMRKREMHMRINVSKNGLTGECEERIRKQCEGCHINVILNNEYF